jgi:uncharacterized membrane protein YcaP (DUF421 family)
MFFVTWAGVRLLGKKSISNMTSFDLAAMMLITTVAAEPLVYKIASKAAVGVFSIAILAILIGVLSLKEFFYNVDAQPTVLVSNGKILEKALKKSRMNIPLLMSELRVQGYQDLTDVAYAILEPNGKLSAIASNQGRPVQPSDMGFPTGPMRISVPIIVDGKLKEQNLAFSKKDREWLMDQIKICGAAEIEDILFAQMDSKGNLYLDLKEKQVPLPNLM